MTHLLVPLFSESLLKFLYSTYMKFPAAATKLQASCSDDGMFLKPAGTDTFWHLLFSLELGSVDAAFMISNKPVNKYPMFCSIF
uniref:Putative secreted protein n=1 Tax=Ixodes ricinus TaxID=34613 RepID=A0A6B0UEG8_IXORI